ncbi:conserved hypothetical protein [Leishmania mexicana MHOM/GT/2001/U1103]|uniref:Cyclic nucleotide-binding domain-containing protein n=1 Tax=Leishmania mexicana (strain MHOM/GT/2001/U1103) TaxID=929439 RepID=E9AZ52_LEIMU|nr:conserved hypothetical protein [Leishmania mexicana MHOM/GT/2001/U1103]CBZ28249.1 conserved hypothetical protein [Leishmania mexicana MHOM/GT/2001/U1103]
MSFDTAPNEAKTATDDTQQRTPSIYTSDVVRRMSRHGSALPLCMSRAQHEARRQSTSIHSASKRRNRRSSGFLPNSSITPLTAMPGANGWSALISCADAHTEVGRAIQMCSFYPSMRVSGTAFENSLNLAHRQGTHAASGSFCLSSHGRFGGVDITGGIVPVLQDDGLRQRTMSISVVPESSATLRDALEESRSVLELSQGSIRAPSAGGAGTYGSGRNSLSTADVALRTVAFMGGSSMVQMACAMKRAAMWEVLVVTALTHRVMEIRFRRQRLRRVLERHLLPTLLKRKNETGSFVPSSTHLKRSASTVSGDVTSRGALLDDAGAVPQGTYLRDHDAFFDSLHNTTLLQSFAETMTRERFLPGDIIARAGDSSQKAMYFLIAGKCEVCTERGGKDGDGPQPADGTTAANGNVRHHQRKIGGGTASRPIKEVIMAGTSFGGVFGGSALFAGTYRALSQCIVWVLRAEAFEEIFRSFADRTMLDKYKEALRQHSLWWLQQWYHPAKCYGSIPIYRKLTKCMSSYLSDFTPVVKVRGETIFSHGDVAGDVYCMLEGTVLRRTKGAAGTYGDDGVAQRLGTNSFTALNVVGRYLMLGEEPHLVPGVQPYTCTVSSRAALFFKVSGERFVNALLDDPLLYAQLRGQLMRQRQENMRLHLECLAYVPLLQRFPAEKREELVQHARPRVIGRSVSLCDPAQHISDLLIIVSGSVRDPRHYNQKATKPLEVPASCEVENQDGTPSEDGGANSHGRSGKADRRHGIHGPKSGHAMDRDTIPASSTAIVDMHATARSDPQSRACEGVAVRRSVQITLSDVPTEKKEVEEDVVEWNFSFRDAPLSSAFSATVTSSNNVANVKASGICSTASAPVMSAQQQHMLMLDSAPLVYPDESEDINPVLPLQPARRFVSTLGGSWEALLLDKWPNGWESVTTVEMWAIPTRMLRLVYNSCTKPVQLSILNGLRHAQKEDLQLPTLPHTKLPPMSIYTHHGEAVAAAAATAAKGSGRRGGDRKAAPPARSGLTAGISGEENGVVGVGTQHSALTRSTGPTESATQTVAVTAVTKEANGKARLLVPVSARQTTRGATLPLSNQKTAQTSRTGADAAQDTLSRGDETQASASARQTQNGRTRSLRRLREAATAQGAGKVMPAEPTVNPALLACYNGVVGAADPLMLRIVRDPVAVVPPRRGTSSAMPAPASMKAAQRLPLIASSSEAASAAAWPTLPVARDRWFHAVPSYEPLPGTAHGAQTLASPPVFAPNSTALASACISPIPHHGKTLEGYVAYYAATVSPARPASRISVDGMSVTGAAVAVPAPAATLKHSPSQTELGTSRIHLPKRRAYAV